MDQYNLADIPAEAVKHIDAYIASPDGDIYMEWLVKTLRDVPKAARLYSENGIEDQIIRDTLADIGLWARRCMQWTGRWGLPEMAWDWLQQHVNGKIFRIGRMQCVPGYFSKDWNFRMFRHKATGRPLVLTAGDADFRSDGQINGTSGIYAGEDVDGCDGRDCMNSRDSRDGDGGRDSGNCDGGFKGYGKTYFEADKRWSEGVLISPRGHAINCAVKLDMDEWDEVLHAGMPVFDLHIPSDGPFDPAVCRASFEKMVDFAARHESAIAKMTGVKVANCSFAAFTLGSWLLNAQLDGILPPESNLVKYLREFYLLPVKSGEDSTITWVFDRKKPNLESPAPEHTRTSLQRSILDFMRNGGRLRSNRGVMLFEDVKDYGNEYYRKAFDEEMDSLTHRGTVLS